MGDLPLEPLRFFGLFVVPVSSELLAVIGSSPILRFVGPGSTDVGSFAGVAGLTVGTGDTGVAVAVGGRGGGCDVGVGGGGGEGSDGTPSPAASLRSCRSASLFCRTMVR